MTTNVYDIPAGLLTSDTRWSVEDVDWIAYVDDSGYDKIVFDSDIGILFAGNLAKIDIWKQWFLSGRIDPAPTELDGISLIIVDIKDGTVQFKTDYLLESVTEDVTEAWYSGTGGPYAKDCWQVNRCAKKAVNTAIECDAFSGGEVKFVDRTTSGTNIRNDVQYLEIMEILKERGMMINKQNYKAVPIKDAANDPSDPTLQAFANKVMSGSVQLNAPFPGMEQPWTKDKKEELHSVLARYAPKK